MHLSDVDVAIATAEAGAAVVARRYGGPNARFAKSATDFATQADLDAEQAMLAVLDEHRPADARIGEESGASGGGGGTRRWLIDPLCGTLNFAAGTPLFAVNVALREGDADLASAVAEPISGDLFWTDGERARRRSRGTEEALVPSARSGLVEINCDGPLDRPFVGGQLVADSLLRAEYGPRVISSTLGVAWVAAGRRAAYVSDGRLHDNLHFAAGIALCEASGCVVSDLAGEPLRSGNGLLIAADAPTHERTLALIAPHSEAVRAELAT
ncbi:inositol monophosphatase family protein [Agromyces endophyticus]|uniref:inositol monophosphatase family protein n=1 Tax=Agromyces sp. H17E-10 TaxID=2932244 RepID=UPI001FD2F331|nr:inositol monophosphatase family protein [Agromyces sp. H17E-10]UOQ90151.1 inositol monophosphatase family protein [Agromyces sp. H17E-10]